MIASIKKTSMSKKEMTFEEAQELREQIIKMFPGETYIVAFRNGNDLISTIGGSIDEMLAMVERLTQAIEEKVMQGPE